ncbi:MAG: TVP38/TMEM64 family protein [Alphaproteobacteria bacterium]|nr:TVP38/TMEM64 family protein [Myxococcales bacterium]MCB9668682.1 TVP38/TMEM64 family protein [Alphaproteobacteria bacterium]MCB9691530.1 TVP38/TMEM64 family protein [Alphaproteobacteria bacterium]
MRTRSLLAVGLGVAVLVGAWSALPDVATVVTAIEWMRDAGPKGDLAFLAFYAVGTVLLFPASWNTGAAGFLYGPFWGALITSLYSTVFAAVAFQLGRTVLRRRVEERLARDARYLALDLAIAERGLPMVVLLRLSPISPFNPMNYLLAATRVRFRDFALGTWLGGLLPAVVWSRVGASVVDLTAFLSGQSTGPGWLQALGLGVTVAITVPITLLARSALREAMRSPLASAEAVASAQRTAVRQPSSASGVAAAPPHTTTRTGPGSSSSP